MLLMKTPFEKIQKSLLLIIILLLSAFLNTGCSGDQPLIMNGKSKYKIFVSESAIPSEKYAARELQKYLKEITGFELPIVNTYDSKTKLIYVGFEDAGKELLAGLKMAEFENEEFIIRSIDGNMLIAGGETRGTLYGVIGFLNNLGCRWYTREVINIPRLNTIYLPLEEIRQKPAFEYREAWYKEAYDTEWAAHNRLAPSTVPIPDSLGGSFISYPFVHTFYRLVSPDIYFADHPEYFSMIDGKRKRHEAQLCLTNSEVVKIATQTVFRWIEEHPEASIFSIDQNDGYGYCECANCKALDDAEGSHSGTLINFVNQIADTVAKVYPKIKLQTLAYVYTEIPPKTLRPADNVTIRMCHYNYCSAHPIGGCSSHIPFVERLEGWDKISKQITIWDYFTDYARYLLPYPNFERMVNDVRFYAENGCVGLFAQGSNVPDNGGGEFNELRAWIFAQLMWNPWQDGWTLIDEFVTNVYGPSAPYISEYIEMMHEQVKPDSVYFTIYAEPTDGGYLTPEIVQRAEQLFIEAEEAASGDPALLKRVELAHLPVLYSRLYFYSTGGRVFLSKEEMPKVLLKFERIIAEHKISRMAEGKEIGDISAFIERVKNAPNFISDWWIIGPFNNSNEKGLETIYPPESEFDVDKIYSGNESQKVKWKSYKNQESGYIDFTKIFHPSENGVAYASRIFKLDKNKSMKIGLGSNDGVRMWLNGRLVLDHKTLRKAEPNQEILTLPFKRGENSVLIKIDQFGGGWGFYFSLLDENYL